MSMSWFRSAAGLGALGVAPRQAVWRVLCYHAVPTGAAAAFRNQLQWLTDCGFRFCSVSDGLSHMARRETGPWLSVTFDDGDATVMSVAQPILDEMSIPAMLYLTTDYVQRGQTYRDPDPRPAASWTDLARWLAAGHEIGSHTHTHAPLSRCSPRRRVEELARSRQLIRDHLGVNPQHFSYPWGQHDDATHELFSDLARGDDDMAWATAATIDRGWNRAATDPLRLRRDVLDPRWSPRRVWFKMTVGNWPILYKLQRAIRPQRGYWDSPDAETFD